MSNNENLTTVPGVCVSYMNWTMGTETKAKTMGTTNSSPNVHQLLPIATRRWSGYVILQRQLWKAAVRSCSENRSIKYTASGVSTAELADPLQDDDVCVGVDKPCSGSEVLFNPFDSSSKLALKSGCTDSAPERNIRIISDFQPLKHYC